ncbi:hypothetical protein NDN08_004780 [Rhodosorus marinus]|uniref:Histidine kinase/HSP90-like ATPase domain-containing protein n=1 Tax=Rhodosorus marinus TaxID=101924 RepID=A0AAV8UMF1_9RHOD|nr:hypothetical protein NDN08_004780 [Rhodosorus marinus]
MARCGSRWRRMPLILVLGIAFLGLAYGVAADPEEVQVDPPIGDEEEGTEKHEFQAETGRLMDIIVHSLYSNREIFIRELISNAADASDKLRMVKLSDEGSLEDDLDIRIAWNDEEKTISVTDRGIGMTKDDLVTNLGTIARSGTSSFLEKFKDAKDESSLIGQFGVGFYSSFLVGNRVTVTSKHEDDSQYAWSSAADGVFTIEETEKADEAERGTTVTLHLRDDALEFLDFNRLKELIRKYSAYIDFPIYLEEHKSEEVEVDVENEPTTEDKEASEDEEEEVPEDEEEDAPSADSDEEQATDKDESEDDDEINVEEDDYVDEEEHDPTKKWETRKYSEWQHVNDQKALWRRDPSEINKDEYDEFYDSIKKSTESKAISYAHFKAEGEVDFKALLFIPDRPSYDSYDVNEAAVKENIRLYVRKVLLKGYFHEGLLPRYLGFVAGVVDSDDLPINISRETLQENKALELIRKKLVRKVLELFKNLLKESDAEIAEKKESEDTEAKEEAEEVETEAEETAAESEEKETVSDDESETESKDDKKDETQYIKFWKQYGVSVKLGCVEDRVNQKRLINLMRFKTSETDVKDENDWASLDDYVSRMKEGQEYIYFLTGTSLESVMSSPFLERLKDKGYEVLYLYDSIDEYWTQQYTDHEGIKLMSLSKDSFAFNAQDEKIAKKQMEEARIGIKPLSERIKSVLGNKVERVKLSNRLRSVPMMISAERTGFTANMELIARAQSFTDPNNMAEIKNSGPKKVVELNPYHPLVKRLSELSTEQSAESRLQVEAMIRTMYDTALVSSGFHVYDQADYAERMARLISKSLDIDYEGLREELAEKSKEDLKLAAEDVRKEEEAAQERDAEDARKRKAEEEKMAKEGEGAEGQDGEVDLEKLQEAMKMASQGEDDGDEAEAKEEL